MKDFFNIDQLLHDLRLRHISGNPVEHEDVDVGFEFVGVDCGNDRFLPKLNRDVVRNELPFAGIFEKSFAYFAASVDRAKHVTARAMKVARDGAERFALSAFAAAGRAEQNE